MSKEKLGLKPRKKTKPKKKPPEPKAPTRPWSMQGAKSLAERCPGCGGLVVMPCLACQIELDKRQEQIKVVRSVLPKYVHIVESLRNGRDLRS